MLAAILSGSMAVMIRFGIPVVIVLGVSSALTLIFSSAPLNIIPPMMQATIQKFSLLTIPLFVFADAVMDKGDISKCLINLADSIVGSVHGGLGYMAVVAALFFAAISGSGTATAAAVGSILVPAMTAQEYDAGFSSTLSAISDSLGTIIPPSVTFIIYGVITEGSIGGLFLLGIVPESVFDFILCIMVFIKSKENGQEKDTQRAPLKEIGRLFLDTVWRLLNPTIVLGGIYSGLFTSTGVATVIAVYSLAVGIFIYKEPCLTELKETLFSTVETTGIILLAVMSTDIFSWVLIRQGIAASLTEMTLAPINNRYIVLSIINIIFLRADCVVDNINALCILIPTIMPIAEALDVNTIQLGVILVLNPSINRVTPSVGPNLYAAADIEKVKFEETCQRMAPLLLIFLLVLLRIIYIPTLSLYLIPS